MHEFIANRNPLINKFNTYKSDNESRIPFQNNKLINNNVNVSNYLNNLTTEYKTARSNKVPLKFREIEKNYDRIINADSDDTTNTRNPTNNNHDTTKYNQSIGNLSNKSLIMQLLQPIKIDKSYNNCNKKIKELEAERLDKEQSYKLTNMPYKNIIKDHVINKLDITVDDLIVYKFRDGIDDDIEEFMKKQKANELERNDTDSTLQIEYDWNNYNKHKKKFEFNESYIKNIAYQDKDFMENKIDSIEYFKQKQKEAQSAIKYMDEIIATLDNSDLVGKEELPV